MKNSLEPLAKSGVIVLFGSGETSPSGRKAFEAVLRRLPHSPNIALLETPAGFELNSPRVAGRIAEFFQHRLQNHAPKTYLIPARARGTRYSPDDPEIAAPILDADLVFMGPGSPSYAVRQLHDSVTWEYLVARHRLGAALVLASAAAIAISRFALPVYEIYKVGEDVHWKPGLDFFAPFNLQIVIVPHWNNNDGGEELDTSRCFMGQERFARLMKMLPAGLTILGIDEKTAVLLDLHARVCQVIGLGGATILHTGHAHDPDEPQPALEGSGLEQVALIRQGHIHQYISGQSFPLLDLGPFSMPPLAAGISSANWQRALQAYESQKASQVVIQKPSSPPPEVLALVEQRQNARLNKEWTTADSLRHQITALGWQVIDTEEGPCLESLSP